MGKTRSTSQQASDKESRKTSTRHADSRDAPTPQETFSNFQGQQTPQGHGKSILFVTSSDGTVQELHERKIKPKDVESSDSDDDHDLEAGHGNVKSKGSRTRSETERKPKSKKTRTERYSAPLPPPSEDSESSDPEAGLPKVKSKGSVATSTTPSTRSSTPGSHRGEGEPKNKKTKKKHVAAEESESDDLEAGHQQAQEQPKSTKTKKTHVAAEESEPDDPKGKTKKTKKKPLAAEESESDDLEAGHQQDTKTKKKHSEAEHSKPDDPKGKNKKTKKEERDEILAQAEDEVEEAIAGKGRMKSAKSKKDHMVTAKNTMMQALEIDSKHAKQDSKKKTFGGLVNMMFLCVLVGCEIDLIGFALAFADYWYMDVLIIKLLLVVMPVGYLVAVFIYFVRKPHAQVHPPPASDDGDTSKAKSEDDESTTYAKRKLKAMDLQFFHFLPIVRYYLIIKEKEAVDIEATFRVNSLSSFTLGVAQISAMIFLLIVQKQSMTIFVKINIISQGINWFITFLYFLTPVSSMMGAQLHVSSLNEKTDDDLRQTYIDYLDLRTKSCKTRLGKEQETREAQAHMECFEMSVNKELCSISGLTEKVLALDQVDMKSKLDALRLLRRKDNLLFARIGH